jgi:aminopeptidase N
MFTADRSSILDIQSYDLTLDLTRGQETFWSRTEVRFRSRQPNASTFADLHALRINRATLNGADLDPATGEREGRLGLPRLAKENVLVVEADFAYAREQAGLHYVTGAFVYSNSHAAPHIYCCFDQPELRATFTVSVNAPAGWSCLANAPVLARPPEGHPGTWKFAPTAPVPPWLTSLCAGPLTEAASTADRESALPITVRTIPSAAARLSEEPLNLLHQSLRFYESTLGVPYPYAKCDLVFAPVAPALAYSVTGLILIQDEVLNDVAMPLVIAHECAHAWFGGLVTMPAEHAWLDEALTTYISRTALAEIVPSSTPWASPGLPDDSYAADAAAIRQLEDRIGQPAVLNGLTTLLRRHAHSQATKDDLVSYWSQASGHDLSGWPAR